MTIDAEGNVYLTGKGVTVFDKTGKKIEQIDVPEPWTANVCFGGKDQQDAVHHRQQGPLRDPDAGQGRQPRQVAGPEAGVDCADGPMHVWYGHFCPPDPLREESSLDKPPLPAARISGRGLR